MPVTNNQDSIPGQEIPPNYRSASLELALEEGNTPQTLDEWLALTKSISETAQDYYEQSLEDPWQRNARHFNNQHETSSKFFNDSYRTRSRLFRPLSRTTERNSSASAATALFSNVDVVDIKASDPNLPNGAQASAIMKALLQYRLEHNVKWYLTAMGAWQDAFVYGPCISYVHWVYEEREVKQEPELIDLDEILGGEYPEEGHVYLEGEQDEPTLGPLVDDDEGIEQGEYQEDEIEEGEHEEHQVYTEGEEFAGPEGQNYPSMRDALANQLDANNRPDPEMEVVKDELQIDLIAPEYFRADPACDWRDVVNSSPYIQRLVPMYVNDIEAKMQSGEWLELSRAEILATNDTDLEYDGVRRAREGDNRADSIDDVTRSEDPEFKIIFAYENYVRIGNQEWVYWTLGSQAIVTEPKHLEDVYFHGKRPMSYGFSVIEAHKYAPNGQSELIAPLQESVNDISNQRIDNLKLAMNKRYVVRRGAQVDLQALARNVPGGSVTADDPERDVMVQSTPDVTASSYEEVNRLNTEANDLAGSFSGSTVQNNRNLNETVGGMEMMNAGANQLQEFDVRTWVESWVKPTLNLAMITCQAYENDETIIAIAGKQGLEKWPEYDIDTIFPNRDDIWNMPMTMSVNVGLGATSPLNKAQNLAHAFEMVGPYIDPSRVNTDEIVKEVFASAGLQDGSKFYMTEEQAAEKNKNKPPELPPEVQIEQMKQEFEMKKLEFNGQIETQKQQIEMQQFQMKLEADIKLKMAELAMKGQITDQQLQQAMAIAGINDKTKRDVEALKGGLMQNEMELRRETGAGI